MGDGDPTQFMMDQISEAGAMQDRIDELTAERNRLQKMLDVCSDVHAHNVKLKAERDEARAEVERLCSLLSETLPHVSHLCQTEQLPNSRHCSGCQHVSYLEGALSSNPLVRGMVTMPAEETFVINRLVDIDVAAVEAAASERAAIVAWMRTSPRAGSVHVSIESSQDIARMADAIERLYHHTDAAAKEAGR